MSMLMDGGSSTSQGLIRTTPEGTMPPNGGGSLIRGRSRTSTLVVPTLNEAKNLPHVLPLIPASVDEVILVDGRSTDDTIAIAREIRPDIKIVIEQRAGKGWALNAGFNASTCDDIVMIDADGSMDPGEIDIFLAAIDNGADFVKGSRYVAGGGSSDLTRIRSHGNKSITMLVNMFYGSRYSDLCYGYIAFRRDVLGVIDPQCAGFEVETLMNIRARRARLDIAEVPSMESERLFGESHLSAWRDGIRIAKVIARERVRAKPQDVRVASMATVG